MLFTGRDLISLSLLSDLSWEAQIPLKQEKIVVIISSL